MLKSGCRIGASSLERVKRLKHRRQFFVFDLDQVERLLGDILVVSSDGCHALAKEAHPIVGQDGHVLHRPAPQSPADIGSGDDGVDAGDLLRRRGVDANDAGVGIGTMQGLAPESAGKGNIRCIMGAARHLVSAIDPWRWLSNDVVGSHPLPSTFQDQLAGSICLRRTMWPPQASECSLSHHKE